MNEDGRLLLCTDLDRTLLPNGSHPESPGARALFHRLAEQPGVVLAYVSGRDRALVEKAIASYSLPTPDWVVSDVGTSISELSDGSWQGCAEWQASIASDWNGHGHDELRELLADLTDLRLQERLKQNTFKLSYYVPLHAARAPLDAAIAKRLAPRGIHASRVWSVDEPAGVGLLDVLPAGATKLHAIEFLRERLGFEISATYYAGDSGNDLDVMASHIPSALVANAAPEVAAAAAAGAESQGQCHRLYLARGGFLGMNGNYAAGLLEGVAHFHPRRAAALGGDAGASTPGSDAR